MLKIHTSAICLGNFIKVAMNPSSILIYAELRAAWAECKTSNWDGNGAFPVQEETNKNACSFIRSLPLDYPLPSVGVEPDGHLTLEWNRDVRWTFSISISPEGIIYYAALFNNEVTSGSEKFSGSISKAILNLIQKAGATYHE